MAIYSFEVQVFSRGAGHSVVSKAAYRMGSQLYDARLGCHTPNYGGRRDVMHVETAAPANAPVWVNDGEALWNRVESCERRKDSELARECRIALPRELRRDQQIALAREWAREEYGGRGMVAQWALHVPGASDGYEQPHIHVMVTTRHLDTNGPSGFSSKKAADFRSYWTGEDAFKKGKAGAFISNTEGLEGMRTRWAELCNRHLAAAGVEARIDHRSLAAQRAEALREGDEEKADMLDRTPEPKIGAGASRRAKRGDLADRVREAQENRREREAVINLAAERAKRRRADERRRRAEDLRSRLPSIVSEDDRAAAKQKFKLQLLAQALEADLPDYLAINIAWVRARDPREEIVVQVRDGARIRDTGRQIATQGDEPNAKTIDLMVQMALAHGWKKARVAQGSAAFKAAATEALARLGIAVENVPAPIVPQSAGARNHRQF